MFGALSIYKDTMKDLYSSIEDCEKFSNVGSPLRSIHDAWVRGCLAGKSCRSPTAFAVPCYQFCWKPTNLSTSLRLWHLRKPKSCLKFWWISWHLESHDSRILGFKKSPSPYHPSSPSCQPTAAFKFAQTCILTVYVANLQPTSLHKHASSPCMLPTYSLQVGPSMHPCPVCCQPTAYKFAQTCILTVYIANLQPTSWPKHASSPCMLPTYSLQVCTNMHPHRVCCQPTAYKLAQACILTVYVANLQPTSLHKHASSPCMLSTYSLQVGPSMHPHRVCCQPTAYKFAQTCILTVYVANLQPTSWPKHASLPCMLPTYSLQVCTNMHPHAVCCQPTAYKFAQTCILTLYVANLQPTSLHKHASSPCILPTYSLQVCTNMHPHRACCQPTAYKFAQTCILTVYVANLQPTSLHKHASSPCMLPTYSLQVGPSMHPRPVCCQPTAYKFAQTCILTLHLANLQPASSPKHASSPCMLPTYSLQVCTNMHPHRVCCQPTAYKLAQACILTVYVANLQPTSWPKHASSPCMLPTYSLQVCTNMHPHRVCCQPTAYKFAQTCILTVYVANLQPTSWPKHASSPCMLPTYSLQVRPNMHPHRVCCQPTAYKFAQTRILTVYVANLQPTSLHKHASSPCMLPTYSLQVCTNMHPHRVCCQPTAYKFAQTCILSVYVANLQPTSLHKHASSPCMLPTYSLQVCTNMHPHRVCCQPTAYKFAQTCILTVYVANLQPTSLHKHASSPCMLPTYSLQVGPSMHPRPVCCQPTAYKFAQTCILTVYVVNLQPVSWPNMHPLRVCCQPTAYKFAQTCILTVYVANLQPTSLHKHASSPCMLPTYSLQVGPSMHPRPVCCQPTAYKFVQTCILTVEVASYSPNCLQVCRTMPPHDVID